MNNIKTVIKMIFLYIKRCIQFREILPIEVAFVDDRELTNEEYEYPYDGYDVMF